MILVAPVAVTVPNHNSMSRVPSAATPRLRQEPTPPPETEDTATDDELTLTPRTIASPTFPGFTGSGVAPIPVASAKEPTAVMPGMPDGVPVTAVEEAPGPLMFAAKTVHEYLV